MKEFIQNFIFQNVGIVSTTALFFLILILVILSNEASRIFSKIALVLVIPWGVLFHERLELLRLYVDVGNNYVVNADGPSSLILLEKIDVIKKEKVLSEELSQNGLTIVKRIEKDSVVQDTKFVLKVKCNDNSYKMCIEKIKINLDNIISSSKKPDGFTVVDL